MGELLWLHSGGSFNKDPKRDLGNYPSKFQISGEPASETNVMNNLFSDILAADVLAGTIDYRCFYIWNPNTSYALTGVSVSLAPCGTCGATLFHGSKLQNDIQQIEILCSGFESTPDIGGFVIFDTEFGPPFTIYYNGNWNQFGIDLQAALNLLPWCTTVTVSTSGSTFTVNFIGEAGNRNVRLIRIVQNNLQNIGISRLNTVTYYACDDWNGYLDSQVKTVQEISNYVPNSGTLKIYNPLTGLWDSYTYHAHDTHIFYLDAPLQFNLVGFIGSCPPTGDVNDAENWQRGFPSPVWVDNAGNNLPLPTPWGVIEAPLSEKVCQIAITKTQQGAPINDIAAPIASTTTTPDATFSNMAIDVGNLRPNEGFYWWIKRSAGGATPCLNDNFSITVSGDKVIWPLV